MVRLSQVFSKSLGAALLASALGAGCAMAGEPMDNSSPTVKTRFGVIDASNNVLMFNGKTTTPKLNGDSGLAAEFLAKTADADFVLMSEEGGTACQTLFSIVKVTASSATPMRYFGNCSTVPQRSIAGDKVSLSFPRFKTLAATTYVYDLKTGRMTQDGKAIPTECQGDVCQ